MPSENCTVCQEKIAIAIFKGTDFCSIDCKKTVIDVSSVGTYMFVTKEEAVSINESRLQGCNLVVEVLFP